LPASLGIQPGPAAKCNTLLHSCAGRTDDGHRGFCLPQKEKPQQLAPAKQGVTSPHFQLTCVGSVRWLKSSNARLLLAFSFMALHCPLLWQASHFLSSLLTPVIRPLHVDEHHREAKEHLLFPYCLTQLNGQPMFCLQLCSLDE